MLPQEVIRAKRDGKALSMQEVQDFIQGLTSGKVSEGQVAAFAMAVFFKGMSAEEAVGLTLAMRDSGTVLKWNLPGPVVDKHSSGGIGDNVSLILAPMLAACGLYVPMISGRGLGHTGGTLDKLDAIPGYTTSPDNELFAKVTRQVGCAIIGQTADLAPADRRLYGIRDVTATVESVPLITASILSKKLAAGLQNLVMDVKCGNGAFMESRADAQALANSLVSVANGAGLKTTALVTDMNEPLAHCAGNAIEVLDAVHVLKGQSDSPRLTEVTMRLGMELLISTRVAKNANEARQKLDVVLQSGKAADVFARMVGALGGPTDFMDRPMAYLPIAPVVGIVHAESEGHVTHVATRELGIAVIELGGGRRRADDKINHAVGLSALAGLNTKVDRQTPLATVHAADEGSFARAAQIVKSSYTIGGATTPPSPILEHIAP